MTYGTPLDEPQLPEWEAREQLCEVGKWLWQRQYVEANGGNMTYRLGENRILATPTMISKGFMKPDDLVILDLEGNQLSGKRKKTSEILVHLQILKHRPDIMSVIHCHPPHATAFAITGRKLLPKCIHPEQEVFLGEVPIAPYETPGTQRVADTLKPYLQDFNMFLLASHGAVAAGKGILDAYWKIEIVEAYCRLLILARTLGEPTVLTQQQMGELLQIKKNLGIHDRRFTDADAQECACHNGVEETKPQAAPSSSAISGADPELIRRVTEAVLKKLGG
jgi:L-fuculose-phosphate aldolase